MRCNTRSRTPSELLITEGTPVDDADTEDQLKEIKVEEPPDATLLDNMLSLLYLLYFTKMLFTTLPDEYQPGPDFYGLPWEPVVFTVFFGLLQIVLNEAKLREEKVKLECCQLQKENTMLTKTKEQLQQEVKDWCTSHAELSEHIKSFEKTQKDLLVFLNQKDDTINALTNYITQLNRLQCESESEDQNREDESDELTNGEVAGDRNEKIKNQIKQMMDVSRTQTTKSVVEEDLKLLQLKLRASMSTKCNLEDQIKKLEGDCNSLQSSKVGLEEECKTLRQKVEILNELYQKNEMALQKKLSQEECERLEKEQQLSAADEKAVSAVQEVKNYKRRIEEMEEELQKTERSFKNQVVINTVL
uniref:transport and Golgi organization protein 1 homolog n=1 Tax=Callospermophilus lateralis TaxID=76772 RepID=UPI00403864F6